MGTHKNLDVWKKSVQLVTTVYHLTSGFPKEEIFGLTNQIRRASVSIPSNIAEGAARISDKELIHFLHIALGSHQELDTQLLIARNLGYLPTDDYSKVLIELETVGKQLNALIKYLKNK